MKRGQLVAVALPGDFGKPRAALCIQADAFETLGSVTVLPVTSQCIDAPLLRIPIEPDPDNGLRQSSQIMIDKAMTIRRQRIGKVIGHIDSKTLVQVDRGLAVFLGIA